jgi:hypothetical protein
MESGAIVFQKLMKIFVPVFLFSSSCADSFPKGGHKTLGFGIDFQPQRCDLPVFKTKFFVKNAEAIAGKWRDIVGF